MAKKGKPEERNLIAVKKKKKKKKKKNYENQLCYSKKLIRHRIISKYRLCGDCYASECSRLA